MGSNKGVRRLHQRNLILRRLICDNIESCHINLSRFQRLKKRLLIDDDSPRGVDNDDTVLHFGKCFTVQQVFCFLRMRTVNGDHIRPFENFFHADLLDAVILRPRLFVTAVCDDLHVKAENKNSISDDVQRIHHDGSNH